MLLLLESWVSTILFRDRAESCFLQGFSYVQSFSQMCHEVILLGGGLGKPFLTERTLIWPFTRVSAHVTDQAPGLIEGLGAVQALKWLLTSVSPHMNLKINTFIG